MSWHQGWGQIQLSNTNTNMHGSSVPNINTNTNTFIQIQIQIHFSHLIFPIATTFVNGLNLPVECPIIMS